MEWAKHNDATLHPLQPHHGETVLKAYFQGLPPFKETKNRNDIPDAFIWQTVLELCVRYGKIHFIVKDGGLFQACRDTEQIIPHSSLKTFFQHPEVKEASAGTFALTDMFIEDNFSDIIEYLERNPSIILERIDEDVEGYCSDYAIVAHFAPDYLSHGPSGIKRVDASPIESQYKFEFNKAEYGGYGYIELPFEVTMNLGDFYQKENGENSLGCLLPPVSMRGTVDIQLQDSTFDQLGSINLQDLISTAEFSVYQMYEIRIR